MEPVLIADERTQLEAFLDTNRDELVETLDGLTEEQARRRLVPSLTTPLGLLKHVTWAEQVWFHVALAGRTLPAKVTYATDLTVAVTLIGRAVNI